MRSRADVEDFVYRSYLKAQPFWGYETRDRERRHPELTRDYLSSHDPKPRVVVTGSKGKGSVCRILSSVLSQVCHTGMLTSPHVISFNERIRFDGREISDEDLIRHAERVEGVLNLVLENLDDGVCVSPIGIQAMIAMGYFDERGTDVDILECGKGAMYDDVPNVPHDYAVINTVFLEHTRELGSTLREIAEDKCTVIRPGQRFAYTAEQSDEVTEVIRRRAAKTGVQLKEYGRDFRCEEVRVTDRGTFFDVVLPDRSIRGLELSLIGSHMARNAALAVCVALDLYPGLTDEDVRSGVAAVRYPGRMEVVSKDPVTVLDACINRACCDSVTEMLEATGMEKPSVIIGIPADKDYAGVAEMLSEYAGAVILTCSSDPHYVFSEEQADVVRGLGVECSFTRTFEDALREAHSRGGSVLIVGTTSLVSDVERFFEGRV